MSVDLDRQVREFCRHMDEAQGALSLEDILERAGELQVIPGRSDHRPSPRRKWLAVAAVGFLVLVVLIGIGLLPSTDRTPDPADQPTTTTWPGPVRPDAASIGIITMQEDDSGNGSWSWEDPEDSAIPWVDITGVKADHGRWWIELAGWPDRDDTIPDGATISHGMVVEMNGDGVADYVLGIDERAPEGPFHVWITDLRTGEKRERTGPPYGDPFDFAHPGERRDDDPALSPPTLHLFPVGAAPPNVFSIRANRFYAWASLTVAGDVFAWDYAPDASWLSIAASEQIPPLSAPEMEPGARVLVIPIENRSGEPAALFVARDTQPMESLVGTVEPSTVAAGQSAGVTFTVPDGENWAIFVNPGPARGPLILAEDIPLDAKGEPPIAIVIGQDGTAIVSMPDDIQPGRFGP